jgi:hypothetical protein
VSEEDTDSNQSVEEDQGVVALSSSEESETREAVLADTQIPKPEPDPVEPNLEETAFKMSNEPKNPGEPAENRTRFMPPKKWVERLQGQPKLLEHLQTVSAGTLNLFGYELRGARCSMAHQFQLGQTGPMSCDMATITCETRNENHIR